MRRFFIENLKESTTSLEINSKENKEEIHHILSVLRLQMNDTVQLTNGKGLEVTAKILQISPKKILFQLSDWKNHPLPKQQIWLIQSLIKPQRLDWLVEKSCELGIQKLLLAQSKYTQGERAIHSSSRVDRLQRLVYSATKQSHNPHSLQIEQPRSLTQILEHLPNNCYKVFLELVPPHKNFWHVLQDILPPPVPKDFILCLFIGPEGGFHHEEVLQLQGAGSIPAYLGENILRAETAAFLSVGLAKQYIAI